jgi:hypothetical protein
MNTPMKESAIEPLEPTGTAAEQLAALGITLQPCPSWCTGDHFGPDPVLFAEDGFHHNGPTGTVADNASTLYQGAADTELNLELTCWVPDLAAVCGPTHIRLYDGGDGVYYLTPDRARQLAADLTRLADQAETACR